MKLTSPAARFGLALVLTAGALGSARAGFFAFDDGDNGTELWFDAGGTAGSYLVADINPERGVGSDPADFTELGGITYFSADDGQSGRELWRSDGTAAGTYLVVDLAPDALGSEPEDLYSDGSMLWFSGLIPGEGRHLYKTEGTATTTEPAATIEPPDGARLTIEATKLLPIGSVLEELLIECDSDPVACAERSGLAYRPDLGPVCFSMTRASDSLVRAYCQQDDTLIRVAIGDVDMGPLDGATVRDLSFADDHDTPRLYVLLTSPEDILVREIRLANVPEGEPAVREAAIDDLGGSMLLERVDEAFGLDYFRDQLIVSLPTEPLFLDPTLGLERVNYGLVRFDVTPGGADGFPALQAGLTEVEDLAGIGVNASGTRRPNVGLTHFAHPGGDYLWSTVTYNELYAADAATGRGFFLVETPPNSDGVKPSMLQLSLSNDGVDVFKLDASQEAVYRIKAFGKPWIPIEGPTRVRRVEIEIETVTTGTDAGAQIRHHITLPPNNQPWRSQGYDPDSVACDGVRIQFGIPSPNIGVSTAHYDPSGDSVWRQHYMTVEYPPGVIAGETYRSRCSFDFWHRTSRKPVYPHHVAPGDLAGAYMEDNQTQFGFGQDPELTIAENLENVLTFLSFSERVQVDMEGEYGAAGGEDPYWRTRNALEYIVEHHDYGVWGDPNNPDHTRYGAAKYKVMLTEDSDPDNDKMACTNAAYSLIAHGRFWGAPARWVGSPITMLEPLFAGLNSDKLWDYEGSFEASDKHRWAQIWLGDEVGWQEFDATPLASKTEMSQYLLMKRLAGESDSMQLITQVAAANPAGFDIPNPYAVGYVSVIDLGGEEHHPAADDESPSTMTWTNPLGISVAAAPGPDAGTTQIDWSLMGAWDLDPGAELEITARADCASNVHAVLTSVTASDGNLVVLDDGQTGCITVRKRGDRRVGGAIEPAWNEGP